MSIQNNIGESIKTYFHNWRRRLTNIHQAVIDDGEPLEAHYHLALFEDRLLLHCLLSKKSRFFQPPCDGINWVAMAILHRSAIYSQTMSLSPRSVVLFSRPIYLWWKDFSNRYHFSFWPMVPYRMATKCTTFLPSYPFPQDRNSVFCSFVDGLFANFRHDGDDLRKLKCRSPFLQWSREYHHFH